MQIIKLGEIITDTASKVKGMLIAAIIDVDGAVEYVFQPKKINEETGQPADRTYIKEGRIQGGTKIDVDVPLEVLNTKVEDTGTGLKGTVVNIMHYINGCNHVEIKPEGTLKNGNTIPTTEVDIRRLKGYKIKPLSEEELELSKKKKPSPEVLPARRKI